MTVCVGLDVGTTGVKAIAVDATGAVVARSESGYLLSTPQAGWAEQDPEVWWRATRSALAALGAQIGTDGEIAGIGLSGQMHGLVALDAANRVVRPAILWNTPPSPENAGAIFPINPSPPPHCPGCGNCFLNPRQQRLVWRSGCAP